MAPFFILHKRRTVLEVSGPDSLAFLQGLVPGDVAKAPLYTALLSPQGRFLADFFIFPAEKGFFLTPEHVSAPALLKKLSLYKLRRAVTLGLREDLFFMSVFAESGAPDPRSPALGVPLVGASLPDLPSETEDTYDTLRYESGISEGAEIGYDRGILLEHGFEAYGALSWTKGCYVGQELMARTKHGGILRKKVYTIRFEGEAPSGDLTFQGISQGRILGVSRQKSLGIALLKTAAAQESQALGLPFLTENMHPVWC